MTLSSIPTVPSFPIIGHTFSLLHDPLSWLQTQYEQHGSVFYFNLYGKKALLLLGPENNQLVFKNPEDLFSARVMRMFIGNLLPDSPIQIDGEKHNALRNILQPLFLSESISRIIDIFNPIIASTVSSWNTIQPINVYYAVKKLILTDAIAGIMGLQLPQEIDYVDTLFNQLFLGVNSLLHYNIPGTPYYRALKAQEELKIFIKSRIQQHRMRPGNDFFSLLCQTKDKNGELINDELISHLTIFLLEAAGHQTTAYATTCMLYYLAKNPELQTQVQNESANFDTHLSLEDSKHLKTLTLIFNECLRLHPPVLFLPFITSKTYQHNNYLLPENQLTLLSPLFCHYMDEYWTNPREFKPQRFEQGEQKQHDYLWIPFGGGIHGCPGGTLALAHAKLIIHYIIKSNRLALVDKSFTLKVKYSPVTKFAKNFYLDLRQHL